MIILEHTFRGACDTFHLNLSWPCAGILQVRCQNQRRKPHSRLGWELSAVETPFPFSVSQGCQVLRCWTSCNSGPRNKLVSLWGKWKCFQVLGPCPLSQKRGRVAADLCCVFCLLGHGCPRHHSPPSLFLFLEQVATAIHGCVSDSTFLLAQAFQTSISDISILWPFTIQGL